MVAQGMVLDVQPLTAIPLQHYIMDEINHPSEEFVDDISKDHSHVKYPNAPPSPPSDYYDITGLDENHAASLKRISSLTFPDSLKKRKATEVEITRVSQQRDEEADKKKIDDLAALRNDVVKLTTKITEINKDVALMSHDVKNISENVTTQATFSSVNYQDLVKKVNILQQSQDAYRETQLHMLNLLTEISNRLGNSVDDVKKREKRLEELHVGLK